MLTLMLCVSTAHATDMPELPTSVQIQKNNDLSASFISNLFGPSWKEIAGNAAADDMGGMGRYHGILIGLLGMMNLAAMTFVSAAIIYYWGIFAVTTAHEGKSIGGSMYNSLWVPVRHAFSFSLTIPVLNGLSVLQVVILSLVSLSINFANEAWDWAGEYIVQNSQAGIIDNSSPLIEDESLMMIQPLFQAAVIAEFVEVSDYDDHGRTPFNDKIKQQALPAVPDLYNLRDYKSVEVINGRFVIEREPLAGAITLYVMPGRGMPLGQLGKVTINTVTRSFKDGKIQPLGATGRAMEQIAEARVQAIIKVTDELRIAAKRYLQINEWFPQNAGPFNYKNGLQIAREYRKMINETTAAQAEIIKNSNDTKGLLESALDNKNGKSELGWMSAGLFSGALAQRQREIDEAVYGGSASFEYPDSDFPDQGLLGDMSRFFGSNNTAIHLTHAQKTMFGAAPAWATANLLGGRVYSHTDAQGDGPGIINRFLAATFMGGTGTEGLVATTLSKFRAYDPIVVLTDFGDRMWTLAGWLAGASVVSSLAGVGSGVTFSAWLGAFSVAVTLKVVAPWAVISIWLYALLHWIIRILEAMVAGPFWAAQHMLPEGNGFAGTHARKGYALMVDILIRPFLLVFGACVSVAVWLGAGQIFSALFSRWLNSFSTYSGGGLIIEIILVTVLMLYFFYLYTKLFVLMISTLPDRIPAWLSSVGGIGGEESSGMAAFAASGIAVAKGSSMIGQAAGSAAGAAGNVGHGLYDRIRGKQQKGDSADLPSSITAKE